MICSLDSWFVRLDPRLARQYTGTSLERKSLLSPVFTRRFME